MGKQKKYYAVARGFKPGIYAAWFGPGGAEEQILYVRSLKIPPFLHPDRRRERS